MFRISSLMERASFKEKEEEFESRLSLNSTEQLLPAGDNKINNETVCSKRKSALHLRKSILEFYRGLLLLKSYSRLNHTGFRKIIKKFDKVVTSSCHTFGFTICFSYLYPYSLHCFLHLLFPILGHLSVVQGNLYEKTRTEKGFFIYFNWFPHLGNRGSVDFTKIWSYLIVLLLEYLYSSFSRWRPPCSYGKIAASVRVFSPREKLSQIFLCVWYFVRIYRPFGDVSCL